MSFNNYSYFTGPSTPNQWWAPNNPNKPAFEENRIPAITKQSTSNPWAKSLMTSDYNNTSFAQSTAQGIAQSMILPSESRSTEPISPHHEVMQGTVTQLFANFGYINDIIIFSKTDVMGQMVQVGDKVAVDATYQPNNPTKYKGERVYKIDETRFNSGKMKPLTQGVNTRIEVPLRSRLDTKHDTRESSPYADRSSRSHRYDNRDLSPRGESSSKNRSDYKYDDREQSPRRRTEYKYDGREFSPRSESSSKYKVDYKYESQRLSPRNDSSGKSRFDNKYESSSRLEGSSSSSKKSSDSKSSKYSNIKDRLNMDEEKHTSSVSTKRADAKRMELIRKIEATKRKAISPIKFHESPKKLLSGKRKSESKSNQERTYEIFSYRELDCAAVKNSCRSLILPKEFFHVSLKYQQSFPLNHPMKLGNNCHFKIMDKKVKSIDPFIDAQLRKEVDPKDADTTFVAKVMLLSTDDLAKFYKDTLTLAEEFDGDIKIPITKAIKFLVASTGQIKEFAIGGAWSPSLDGPDPETNPRVLINTAIRTCKAMTGIDLSSCSSWPKFLELRYYRPMQKLQRKKASSNDKNETIDVDASDEPIEYKEPRMETVVYYVPDVWNCVPSEDSWREMNRLYQEQMTCIMCPPPPVSIKATVAVTTAITSTNSTEVTTDGAVSATITSNETKSTNDDNNIGTNEERKIGNQQQEIPEEDWNFNGAEEEEVEDKEKNSEETGTVAAEGQATHFSKLVIAGMKIVDIRRELELRNLNSKGVMEQLKARLKSSLEREESDEKTKAISSAIIAPEVQNVPSTMLTDDQRNDLKKLYMLPDQPQMIVHQNRKIADNQMKMKTMSLHTLLSYHNETLPENTFELALFGRQFLDMLRRDAVFNIYKSIVIADDADLCNVEDASKKPRSMVTTSKRTVNRPLLFSCTLMDRDGSNRLSLEELRMLIEGLGICLSSDQLASVLEKVKDTSRYLNYRQLTDKEMTDTEIARLLSTDVSEDLDYIKELALGNKALFESEEAGPLDCAVTDCDAMERLKNELDKSERCRQSIELKVAEMKDETAKNISLVQTCMKEIEKLKEQSNEYRTKYYGEHDRSEFYKRDFERLLRYMKDVDGMTLSLNKFVSGSLQKYITDTKKVAANESTSSVGDAKNKSEKKNVEGTTIEDDEAMDEEGNRVSIELSNDVDMPEKMEEESGDNDEVIVVDHNVSDCVNQEVQADSIKMPVPVVHSCVEDFDLARPSEYDMIILDETE